MMCLSCGAQKTVERGQGAARSQLKDGTATRTAAGGGCAVEVAIRHEDQARRCAAIGLPREIVQSSQTCAPVECKDRTLSARPAGCRNAVETSVLCRHQYGRSRTIRADAPSMTCGIKLWSG